MLLMAYVEGWSLKYVALTAAGELITMTALDVQFVFDQQSHDRHTASKSAGHSQKKLVLQVSESAGKNALKIEDVDSMRQVAEDDTGYAERRVMRRLLSNKVVRRIQISAEKRRAELTRLKSGAYEPETIWEKVTKLQEGTLAPGTWPRITVDEILDMQEPIGKDELTRYALHNIVMSRPDLFLADENNMLITGTFSVRPRVMLEDYQQAIKAIVAYETIIADPTSKTRALETAAQDVYDFIAEVRPIVEAFRQQPLGTLSVPHDLSPGARRMVRMLKQALLENRTTQKLLYLRFMNTLIRATQLFPAENPTTHSEVAQLLYELGELGAAGDMSSLRLDFLLSTQGQPDVAQVVGGAPMPTSKFATPNDVTTVVDSVQSIRHDFGDLPVYVIDSADARELDDGVSFETISDSTDVWLHIHIADPTRWISPGDELATRALTLGSSYYVPDRFEPMIPEDLVMSHMSLGALRGGQPQPTLTFSARVNLSGDIVDYKVRAGHIRNVKITTYKTVAQVLDQSQAGDMDASDPMQRDIQGLSVAIQALQNARLKDKGLLFVPETSEAQADLRADRLSVTWKESGRNYRSAMHLVTECMLLAGHIAGRFGRDHAAPLPYRGTLPFMVPPHLFPELSPAQRRERILAERGPGFALGWLESSKYTLWFPPVLLASHPLDHWMTGFTAEDGGNVRATSPLRRFSDLVVHWQIKSILAQTGGRPQDPTKTTPLFDATQMYELVKRTHALDQRAKRIMARSDDYYQCLAIKHALEMNNGVLNGVNLVDVPGIVVGTARFDRVKRCWHCDVMVPSLELTSRFNFRVDETAPATAYDGGSAVYEMGQAVRLRFKEPMLWPTPTMMIEDATRRPLVY